MPHTRRLLAPRRKVFTAPDLRLKTDIHLADVMQSRQDTQPCRSCPVQVAQAARAGQSLADCRLLQ